jgi:hypothetical protein
MGRVRTGRMKKEKTEEGEGMAGLRQGRREEKAGGRGSAHSFL